MLFWLYKILFFVVITALLIAGYYWYIGSNQSVAVIVQLPDHVPLGAPFTASIAVANNTDRPISSAKITLIAPEGVAFVGEPEEKNILNKTVGDVAAGGLNTQEVRLIVTRVSNEPKKMEALVNYGLSVTASRFEIKQDFTLVADVASGIALELKTAEQTTNSDNFEIKVYYKNNTAEDVRNMKLQLTYPPAFTFKKATLSPDEGMTMWDIGGLHRGSEGDLSIFGALIAPTDAVVDFKASLLIEWDGQTYHVNDQVAITTMQRSPFDISIQVDGKDQHVASPGETLSYSLSFADSLNSLRVQLSGEMFELGALGTNVLSWSVPHSPVTFEVRLKTEYPLRRFGDRNFILRASAEGRRGKEVVVAKSETKVRGQIKVAANGYFRDAVSGFINQGPLPPKVGESTQFTIHWLLQNYGTDVKQVTVHGKLSPGVKFVTSKSSLATAPQFDAVSGEVVWEIDRLLATQGILGDLVEAIVQVEATPTADIAGRYMSLLGETMARGIDEFVEQDLTTTAPEVTTAVPNDLTVGSQGAVTR